MPMGQQQANASDRREPQHVVFLSGSRSVVDVEINRDTTAAGRIEYGKFDATCNRSFKDVTAA